MKPAERHTWIEEYLRKRATSLPHNVNVLDAYFVEDYIHQTRCKFGMMPFGAHRCPQLGRDLAAMFKAGTLRRRVVGIDGLRGQGFPAWVYDYLLKENHEPKTA